MQQLGGAGGMPGGGAGPAVDDGQVVVVELKQPDGS